MQLLEKEIEDAIYNATDDELRAHGLGGVVGEGIIKRFRQLDLDEFGRADLVFIGRQHYPYRPVLKINVIELKKDKVGLEALGQALRYTYAIQSKLKERGFKDFGFRITLIGMCSSCNFMYLPHLLYEANSPCVGRINSINVYGMEYDINGLYFVNQSIGQRHTKTKEDCLCTKGMKTGKEDALPF